ncbi:(deoxy)nucleoside triphosphate pyrophosphohydrolase [Brevibacterium sp. 50QC2O2]|uniref:(deoxy)nucleoside triphosphate pyrophosphohydrolase n=1 Tax=Brevibacterium TaxID=1696 RepID=UPI00211C51AC|nr:MULTISPECIES: (deoxy)nucleoside triphosphate pyrophosphohydrolase [unclassified Brevibacterium]MCQ9386981.1 (deoxy)nucleoside triphosphate pyrophosphohydrolase [Brevibacterium sp. 68QC2CO]MCQ9389952.1 (deoxy)nucleoside triphosphate pyrophosphohydrolase [Brevibacterium sp. 50QC2O2]
MRTLPVVGAVFRNGDSILACRRRPEKSAGGLWEFPGGKIEPGELPEVALARELREELGLEHVVIGERVFRQATMNDEGLIIDLDCYWVEGIAGNPVSSDHDRMDWVPVRELRSLTWAGPDVPIVIAVQNQLRTDQGGTQA